MIKLSAITFLSLLFIILSCGDKNKQDSNQPEQVVIDQPNFQSDKISYVDLDSTIRKDIEELDRKYSSTPFYAKIGIQKFFITCTGKYNYGMKRFGGTFKYGLAAGPHNIILESVYDKIYNPNLVLKKCFEIRKDSKIGLVNYESGEILQPQFEYIFPGSNSANDVAYGFKNNKWFKISSSNIGLVKETEFDPVPILKALSFNILNVGESMMFDSYYKYYTDEVNEGRGVVIVPSYIEYLKLLPRDSYTDVILPNQGDCFGTDEARLNTSLQEKIKDKIISFFVSIYESGIDARGYQTEGKELIVYNKERNIINSVHLDAVDRSDYFCRESDYRIVNDSIIEVKSNHSGYNPIDNIYNFETQYTYHKISKDGSIKKLVSNRHFEFTKFILIDENHFKGCYAWSMEEPNDEYNMWISDHLSIHDLDIMRNEIFAEYGYKFKSEEWQKFFNGKPWYKPLYDNVDNLLSEIDKANIKLILRLKEQMEGNEQKYTNKRQSNYVAAG